MTVSYEALMDARRDREAVRSTVEQTITDMVGRWLWEQLGVDPDRLTVTVSADLTVDVTVDDPPDTPSAPAGAVKEQTP